MLFLTNRTSCSNRVMPRSGAVSRGRMISDRQGERSRRASQNLRHEIEQNHKVYAEDFATLQKNCDRLARDIDLRRDRRHFLYARRKHRTLQLGLHSAGLCQRRRGWHYHRRAQNRRAMANRQRSRESNGCRDRVDADWIGGNGHQAPRPHPANAKDPVPGKPSCDKSHCLRGKPPPKPVNDPSAPITR
jgi:transcriptional regulator of met regulon